MAAPSETFISVDVETSGPYPERYSLLSIGACVVENPDEGFYIELKPAKNQVLIKSQGLDYLFQVDAAFLQDWPKEAKDWKAAPAWNSVASSNGRPMICMPTGRPSWSKPQQRQISPGRAACWSCSVCCSRSFLPVSTTRSSAR